MKYAIVMAVFAAMIAGAVVSQMFVRVDHVEDNITLVTLAETYVVTSAPKIAPHVIKIKPAVVPDRRRFAENETPSEKPAPQRWTLSFSCADVKYYNSHYTHAQIEAMRTAAHMAMPSADQQAQIRACLAGKIK